MDEMDDLFGTLRGDAAGFRREIAALRAEIGGPLVSETERAGQAIERALTRAVTTGKLGFEDLKRLAMSVMADIARAVISNGIASFGGGAQGSGGGGGRSASDGNASAVGVSGATIADGAAGCGAAPPRSGKALSTSGWPGASGEVRSGSGAAAVIVSVEGSA